jgi:hypothetical protein
VRKYQNPERNQNWSNSQLHLNLKYNSHITLHGIISLHILYREIWSERKHYSLMEELWGEENSTAKWKNKLLIEV